jgi:nucleoside-diphosphate-sugar epimerase
LDSAKAIVSGLTPSDGRRRLYVHTSGSAILAFGAADARGQYATPDSEVWSDLQFDRYTSIPQEAPHRVIDSEIISAATAHPNDFDLVIVCPPTIYGKGSGPGNQMSQQIPLVVKMALDIGRPGTVGRGLNKWNSVHVEDLADLYTRIIVAHTSPHPPPSIAHGGGIYFSTTGEFVWGDVQRAVGAELVQRGLIQPSPTPTPQPWTEEEVDKAGGKFVWIAIASNSRYVSERAEKEGLGWKPKHVNAVMTSIKDDIDGVLARQKKSGGK